MSRSRSLPPAVDHAQHDTLLVAQLAAADELPEEQLRAATALVSGCPECAVLAADLRTIQLAVAHELVPPRRRDHRLSPGQAERLRGSAVRRLLRRLALPEAGALRPVAAGVLSLGLLFVAAGTVWPEDLVPATGGIPEGAPQELQALPGPGEEGPILADASATPTVVRAPDAEQDTSADAGAAPPRQDAIDAETGTDIDAGDAAADGVQLEAAAAASDPSLAGLRDEAGPADDAARSQLERGDEPDPSSTKADLEQVGEAAAAPEALEFRAVESPAPESLMAESLQSNAAEGEEVDAEDRLGTVTTDAVEAVPADPDRTFETALIAVGSLLVLGGLALLLVVWLARRLTRDPLLR